MQLSPSQSERITTASFLVTGGAGFIGSHIAEFLLNAGARKVRVLDNQATGHFRNVAPFANHPNFEFVRGDIRDLSTCKAACKGIDYVFHQAAVDARSGSINDPVLTNNINTSGFLNMLMVAQDARVKRFVYASRSSVHEDTELPETEKITDINELYAYQFSRLYGMETIGLRYCNVFGQRQHLQSEYAAVIPAIVMQLRKHESPLIDGAGECASCYTYIKNVVQANMLAVLTTEEQAINQVYNITFDERTSLHQLADCLKELLSAFDDSIARIQIMHERSGEDMTRAASFVEKAKRLLGYQPHYSLRDGLLQSAGWYWTYLPQFQEEIAEKRSRKLEITN
ncbi:MAG TPA: NAD-dependent epimerase/dehydratase family protein [Niastella sp.]